jgi:hypothetical protein
MLSKDTLTGRFTINPNIYYFNSIKSNIIFNFLTMSLVSIIISTIYAYYLFVEAKIQFKNRKYYLTVNDNFLNIFNFPISFIFSILLSILFGLSVSNFIYQVAPTFNPEEVYVPYFTIIYLIPATIIFFFFYKWQKHILFNLLLFWNNIASTVKRDLNEQIYNAKINNTFIWLVLIRVSNLNEASKKFKKNPKKIFNLIIKNLKSVIRTTDYIVTLNSAKGLFGYIVTNDEKSLNELLQRKIKPFLTDKIKIKDDHLDLVINYQIIDIAKNEDINTLKDITNYIKKTIGKF